MLFIREDEMEREEEFYFVAPREPLALVKQGTLRAMLFDGTARELVKFFAIPVQPQYSASTNSQARDNGDALILSMLPPEIYYLIFDHMECIEDVVCFGFTHSYFWPFARSYLDDHYKSFLGIWAGKNFVCIGNHIQPDDYPPDLFSAEELNKLRQRRVYTPTSRVPFALCHFADPKADHPRTDFVDPRWEALDVFRRYFHRDDRGGTRDVLKFKPRMIPTRSTYYPRDQPWVLRNLTTKEFVRAEGIAIKPEYVHGPNIELAGFGEVIILRTCWSGSLCDIPINGTTGQPRGVWAGHRLDITTLAKHKSELDSAKWSDVSDKVAKELADIWFHRFGTDIREGLPHWYQRPLMRDPFKESWDCLPF
ncbi:hypothetical protein F5X97DRAFT_311084 [Nemania serpens]|nr:hypothetical protein F5X97DRAFT_311084 [Nemania serpens]